MCKVDPSQPPIGFEGAADIWALVIEATFVVGLLSTYLLEKTSESHRGDQAGSVHSVNAPAFPIAHMSRGQ